MRTCKKVRGSQGVLVGEGQEVSESVRKLEEVRQCQGGRSESVRKQQKIREGQGGD